jgi:DNA-binding HxlR family transcriptional regulator
MEKIDKKSGDQRSKCPLSCSLELLGDKWSLLIIRDIMFFGKSAYNEFLNSPEGISTNILNERLIKLSSVGLIGFSGSAKRKRYFLTKMGDDLKPILEAVGVFGMKYYPACNNHFNFFAS